MIDGDLLVELKSYIDERWAVIQPNVFPLVDELHVRYEQVCPREAEWFLASLAPHAGEPPFFKVEDDNKVRSDRDPPNANRTPKGGTFFEGRRKKPAKCWLRLETIVQMGAMWRLHDEFGWPREHLVDESPGVIDEHGVEVVTREALDILALEDSYPQLPSRMTFGEVRTRVAIEVKADGASLSKLLHGMQVCQGESQGLHEDTDHKKCLALQAFRPELFLGVAAGETWRVFGVEQRDGRAVVGAPRDLDCLNFGR